MGGKERAGAGLGSGSWEEVEVKTEGRIRNLEETGNELDHTSFIAVPGFALFLW